MKTKIFTLVIVTTLLSACLSGRDYQKTLYTVFHKDFITSGSDYQFVLDSWVGYDIDLLVRRWGSPTSIFSTRNGNSIHVFGKSDLSLIHI